MQDHGQHDRQRQRTTPAAVLPRMALENTEDVAEDAQRHQMIDAALVLEQQIDESRGARDGHREEQIGFSAR